MGRQATIGLKVGNNITYAYTDRKVINSTGDGFRGCNELSAIRYALIAAPILNLIKADGTYYNTSTELGDPTIFGDGNAILWHWLTLYRLDSEAIGFWKYLCCSHFDAINIKDQSGWWFYLWEWEKV